MNLQDITNKQNEIINNIFSNKDLFVSMTNKVLSEVLPNDLKDEFKNASETDKKALMTYMISSLSFELAFDKLTK